MKSFVKGLGIFTLFLILFIVTLGSVEIFSKTLLHFGKSPAALIEKEPSSLNDFNLVKSIATKKDHPHSALANRLLAYGIETYQLKERQTVPPLRFEPGVFLTGEKTKKSIHGLILAQDIDDTFVKVGQVSGEPKLQFHLKTNQYHRRHTSAETIKANENFFFYGCSFTLGEGVEDEETIPYQFSKFHGGRSFNFGHLGSGPADFLRNLQLHKDQLFGGIPNAPTTVIYTFIDDHMRRVVRSSQYLSMFEDGHSGIYFYSLDQNENLNGMEGKDTKFSDFLWFRTFFGRTAFSKISAMEIPWINDSHYQLFAKILAEQKRMTKEKFPQMNEFIMVVFPSEKFYIKKIRPFIEAEGIRIIDYSDVGPGVLNTYEYLIKDGHPSADLYRLYAWLLSGDIPVLKSH